MTWIEISKFNPLPKEINEWRKIWRHFPPSFFVVWVMNGKRKMKGYFDAPNRSWYEASKNPWRDRELHNVTSWKALEEGYNPEL